VLTLEQNQGMHVKANLEKKLNWIKLLLRGQRVQFFFVRKRVLEYPSVFKKIKLEQIRIYLTKLKFKFLGCIYICILFSNLALFYGQIKLNSPSLSQREVLTLKWYHKPSFICKVFEVFILFSKLENPFWLDQILILILWQLKEREWENGKQTNEKKE
jgi:hypothetical protein